MEYQCTKLIICIVNIILYILVLELLKPFKEKALPLTLILWLKFVKVFMLMAALVRDFRR
jgi:branched-subunit amino acid transport protein